MQMNKINSYLISLLFFITSFIDCERPNSSNLISYSTSIPDYETVFPQDRVLRFDIKIGPEKWQAMLDDMTDMYGEFGASGNSSEQSEESIEACEGMDEGDPCTFETGDIEEVTGSCFQIQDQLLCMQENIPPDDGMPPGGGIPPGGGMPPGGQMPTGDDRNPIWVPCTVEFDGNSWYYVGIRFKGNSSLKSSWSNGIKKLPVRFDFDQFENEYPEVRDQRFFDFKKLTMSSGWSDNSLIREKITADIFRDAGIPAPQTAFCRLYIDYGEGPVYFGLYTLVEPPYYPMLEAQFDYDGGNLYKCDGTGAMFGQFDEVSFDKETNEDDNDWSDIITLFDSLHYSRDNIGTWKDGLEGVFNVDGFLRWLAVNTVIQNWDTYGKMSHNYYLYSNPRDGLIHWIPWDNNMALSDKVGLVDPHLLTLDDIDETWPLIRFLIDNPEYHSVYVDYMEEFVENVFTITETRTRYQEAHELIEPYAVGPEGEIPGYTHLNDPQDFYDELDYLFNHVQDRNDEVDNFLLEEN